MTKFSKALVKARKKLHISQQKMGERIGVPRVTIASWEYGRTLPRLETLPRVAEHYDLDAEKLLELWEAHKGSRNVSMRVNGECRCGQKITPEMKYCPECGRKLI